MTLNIIGIGKEIPFYEAAHQHWNLFIGGSGVGNGLLNIEKYNVEGEGVQLPVTLLLEYFFSFGNKYQ